MSALGDAVARYGAIAVGLTVGTAARYGLAITDGKPLTWKGVLADMLLLGLVALMAVLVSDRLGLSGDTQAFAAALLSLSSDRMIKLLRQWALKRAASELPGA
jgi:NhaP-type Na+/H+ or K+/H+ antiporter